MEPEGNKNSDKAKTLDTSSKNRSKNRDAETMSPPLNTSQRRAKRKGQNGDAHARRGFSKDEANEANPNHVAS